MSLTAAEAWCWVSWMLGRESDALLYKYPRSAEDEDKAEELRQCADAAYARATKLDPSEDLWRRSLDLWDGVSPDPARSAGQT